MGLGCEHVGAGRRRRQKACMRCPAAGHSAPPGNKHARRSPHNVDRLAQAVAAPQGSLA